ncbi:hypothetical protein EXS71_03085 [Candidatus Uhrbacteria bacterium]|nr:hypothetical protein [Candidatus Uhrbacteria bacterium]
MTNFSFRGPASDDWNPQNLNEDELEGKKEEPIPDEDEEDKEKVEKKEPDEEALAAAEADDLVALDLLAKQMEQEKDLRGLGDDTEEI